MFSYRPRRQRGTGKKAQKDFAADRVKQFAGKLMVNRWQLLAPFPLERIDLYRAAFSVEQHKALDELLRTAPTMLNMGRELTFKFDAPVSVMVQGLAPRPRYFKITLDMEVPMPDTDTLHHPPEHPLLVSQLPPHLREPLIEWAHLWLKAGREAREVCGKLERLFDLCTTMGQIKRVWPNACNLLPEQAQAQLREAKVRSPYALAMLDIEERTDGRETRSLKDEWTPQTLEWYDERLTEALCLPMMDGRENWKAEIEYAL